MVKKEKNRNFFKKIKDKLSPQKDKTKIRLGDFIDSLEELKTTYEEIDDGVIDIILEKMGYDLEKELENREKINLANSLKTAISHFKSLGIEKMKPSDMEIFINKL
jgi:hypothetical protein